MKCIIYFLMILDFIYESSLNSKENCDLVLGRYSLSSWNNKLVSSTVSIFFITLSLNSSYFKAVSFYFLYSSLLYSESWSLIKLSSSSSFGLPFTDNSFNGDGNLSECSKNVPFTSLSFCIKPLTVLIKLFLG